MTGTRYLDECRHQFQKGNSHCILPSWLLDQHQQVSVVTRLHTFSTVVWGEERNKETTAMTNTAYIFLHISQDTFLIS